MSRVLQAMAVAVFAGVIALTSFGQSARADTVTLNHTHAGNYRHGGANNAPMVADNDITIGNIVADAGNHQRAFLGFAIPNGQPILSATLRLDTGAVVNGPNNIAVRLMPTGVTLQHLIDVDPDGAVLYTSLGQETPFATYTGATANETIEIALNSDAITALNAARGGGFALSLSNATASGNDDIILGTGAITRQLVIVRAEPVPTLTEWAMIGLTGLLALGGALTLTRMRQRRAFGSSTGMPPHAGA